MNQTNVSVTYSANGFIHRADDLPAIIQFRVSGDYSNKKLETYNDVFLWDRLSSEETWIKKGLICRDNDKPAITLKDKDDSIEKWGFGTRTGNFQYHRIYGPACIIIQEGAIRKTWYFKGKVLPKNIPIMDGGKFVKDCTMLDIINTTMNFSREYGLLMWEEYVKLNPGVPKLQNIG